VQQCTLSRKWRQPQSLQLVISACRQHKKEKENQPHLHCCSASVHQYSCLPTAQRPCAVSPASCPCVHNVCAAACNSIDRTTCEHNSQTSESVADTRTHATKDGILLRMRPCQANSEPAQDAAVHACSKHGVPKTLFQTRCPENAVPDTLFQTRCFKHAVPNMLFGTIRHVGNSSNAWSIKSRQHKHIHRCTCPPSEKRPRCCPAASIQRLSTTADALHWHPRTLPAVCQQLRNYFCCSGRSRKMQTHARSCSFELAFPNTGIDIQSSAVQMAAAWHTSHKRHGETRAHCQMHNKPCCWQEPGLVQCGIAETLSNAHINWIQNRKREAAGTAAVKPSNHHSSY
jgi:hypothetical protein